MSADPRTSESEKKPLSATESMVAALWSEVLQGAELPSLDDNFFEVGGESMAMVMLEFRIKEEFAIDLPVGALLGAPTLKEVSTLIDSMRTGVHGPST